MNLSNKVLSVLLSNIILFLFAVVVLELISACLSRIEGSFDIKPSFLAVPHVSPVCLSQNCWVLLSLCFYALNYLMVYSEALAKVNGSPNWGPLRELSKVFAWVWDGRKSIYCIDFTTGQHVSDGPWLSTIMWLDIHVFCYWCDLWSNDTAQSLNVFTNIGYNNAKILLVPMFTHTHYTL